MSVPSWNKLRGPDPTDADKTDDPLPWMAQRVSELQKKTVKFPNQSFLVIPKSSRKTSSSQCRDIIVAADTSPYEKVKALQEKGFIGNAAGLVKEFLAFFRAGAS